MYSPKIDEKLIPELYRLKQKTKKPMTVLVNEAVVNYLTINEIGENNELEHNKSNPRCNSSSFPGFCERH